MLPCHLSNLPKDLSSVLGKVQRVQPPVLRICPALDEFSLFELVQDGHEPAGMDLQPDR